MIKENTLYYFKSRYTGNIDHCFVLDVNDDTFTFRWNGKIMSASASKSEGLLFESKEDPVLLSKVGMCRGVCVHGRFFNCNRSCPCGNFAHVDSELGKKRYSKIIQNHSYFPSPDTVVEFGER